MVDMQKPLSEDEYKRRSKEFKSRGAFGSIWVEGVHECAYSAHKNKVAKIAMARMSDFKNRKIRGNEMENLREMARVLLVDRIAADQESGEEIWDQLDNVNVCRGELMETVPDALSVHGVTLDPAIDLLIPEMTRIVAAVDEAWNGKLTLEMLEKVGGDKVYTSTALQAAGHGVSIDDDPVVYDLLKKLKLTVPGGIYLDDSLLENAVYMVSENLTRALEHKGAPDE